MGRKFVGLWPLALAVAIESLIAWAAYGVWSSPHRTDLATYGAFVVAFVPITTSCFLWAWRTSTRPHADAVAADELDQLADLLSIATEDQWTAAAGDRRLLIPEPIPVQWRKSSDPLAGPLSAVVDSKRFSPLPGLSAIKEHQLQEGAIADLHAIYGGLGTGRLVIVGAPGSGKSGAAILLILAALSHRKQVTEDDRQKVPVPVMFTMHGWDPEKQSLENWLEFKLRQTYPFLAGKHGKEGTRALLRAGRVAVILDGLDEIPTRFQSVALQAISQQAGFRIVVLARSAEMALAAQQGYLEGSIALELQDINPIASADYLVRVQLDPAPARWRELIKRLREAPSSPLSRALSNPLTLTLIRDTYRSGDDIGELLDFCGPAGRSISPDDIVDHLLGRVIPAAYAKLPGRPPPRYNVRSAEDSLCHIAAQLNEDNSRDLNWWLIPSWVSVGPRLIASALIVGLAQGLAVDVSDGPIAGLAFGLASAAVFSLLGERVGRLPERVSPPRWRQFFRFSSLVSALSGGLLGGIVCGVVIGLTFGLLDMFMGGQVAGMALGLAIGLVTGFALGSPIGFGLGLFSGASQPEADSVSSLNPLTSWRSDRAHGLLPGLLTGSIFLLVAGFVAELVPGFKAVRGGYPDAASQLFNAAGYAIGYDVHNGVGALLLPGLIPGLVAGLVVWLAYPQTWPASLAFAQLSIRGNAPTRLMSFLEDARERNILRTVGPVYQFRHARLQDHLAQQALPIKRPRHLRATFDVLQIHRRFVASQSNPAIVSLELAVLSFLPFLGLVTGPPAMCLGALRLRKGFPHWYLAASGFILGLSVTISYLVYASSNVWFFLIYAVYSGTGFAFSYSAFRRSRPGRDPSSAGQYLDSRKQAGNLTTVTLALGIASMLPLLGTIPGILGIGVLASQLAKGSRRRRVITAVAAGLIVTVTYILIIDLAPWWMILVAQLVTGIAIIAAIVIRSRLHRP